MHCFKKLEGCKKWDRVRLTLNDGKTGEEGLIPMTSTFMNHLRDHSCHSEFNVHYPKVIID
jgi:hypothetical protein